jgi:ketosteroid isomerase-like protein
MADEPVATIGRLNETYIEAVLRADGDLFETILDRDFLCSNPDGTLLDREEFVRRIRASQPMTSLDIDDVRIRVFGDIALVHARTLFELRVGRRGTGRYTDVWARRNGRWLAVSAHVTRLPS